jgi:hypothetical protein
MNAFDVHIAIEAPSDVAIYIIMWFYALVLAHDQFE